MDIHIRMNEIDPETAMTIGLGGLFLLALAFAIRAAIRANRRSTIKRSIKFP